MCGISGIYQPGGAPVDAHTLRSMIASIGHRGPDDQGYHLDGDLGLGMCRLSIIDPAGGRQPISNEDRSVTAVCNGEIYNFQVLREQMQRRGHRFTTGSDSEVIVHLYEELGGDCVRRLRGMFAFAVWDARRRRLFVARDRLGIKPLYYTHAGGRLIFASEIKAILRHPAVDARVDPEALSHFLSLKYVPAPQTFFAGIAALPPGHALTCDEQGLRCSRYWNLSFAPRPHGDEEECASELERLLRECVRLHLVSDVPFGAFLSGGLDSSTIVALMSQCLNRPVRTFSVGFEGEAASFSELPYARLVADRYGTDHHEVIIRAGDLVERAEKVLWHLDQPIADDAALANYMVADLASRHVKMVLTGEGGDELFAGYARYAGERMWPAVARLPAPLKAWVLAAGSRLPALRRPKIALYALCQDSEARRLANWFPLFNDDMKAALLTSEFKQVLNGANAADVFACHLRETDAADALSRMLYVDTKLWLPDDLLARGDKTSMAASIEARVPLLDHVVVEFAASLPSHFKLRRFTRKYLLRKVSRHWLPREIIRRRKKGFPMPMALWLRGKARPFLQDVLAPGAIRRRGVFDPATVQRLIDEHQRGFADHGSLLWSLVSVELWHRLFIDSSPRAGA